MTPTIVRIARAWPRLCAIVCVAAACASSGSGGVKATPLNFAPSLNIDLGAMKESPTGLWTRDLDQGAGRPIANGDVVRVRYTLWLTDGRRMEGIEGDDPPFEFKVGARQVIAGWEEGILGMRAGGRRQLVVPPTLGYGGRRKGDIPGASVLVFDLRVIEIVRQ